MKLASLTALVAAIEEGSLRGAARRLNISQPALTKMLRALEVELSATLLIRTSKGVKPTEQGKALHARALTVTRELKLATDEISQLSGNMSGELTIGAVPLAVMLIIPETLRTFCRAFPNIRIKVTEELYIAQLQRLRKGEVDVAVGGIPDDLPKGEFTIEPLMTTTMVVVARKGHPLAQAKSLHELEGASWVYTGANSDSGYVKALFETNGMPAPKVGAIVNSTLSLLSIVASGDVLGLMPQQIAIHPTTAQFISVVPIAEKGLDLTVGAIIRSDSVVSPAIRHLITHMHRAAQ
jgi:DNA-binding transcriptional LysR family regulator